MLEGVEGKGKVEANRDQTNRILKANIYRVNLIDIYN